MKRTLPLATLSILLPGALLCASALAQPAPGRGPGPGLNAGNVSAVSCQSNNSRRQTCNTGWSQSVLVRQLSTTRCVEGQNWGSGNGSIWVSNGCRAEFGPGRGGWGNGNWNRGGGETIRCDSNDNRSHVCRTDWNGAVLVRQVSNARCIEGRTWGSSDGAIWVTSGCRAEFAEARGGYRGPGPGGNRGPGPGYSMECSSDSNRRQACAWDNRQGRPRMIQQLSNTQCVEGRNWGYDGNGLWVDGGCRARFGTR